MAIVRLTAVSKTSLNAPELEEVLAYGWKPFEGNIGDGNYPPKDYPMIGEPVATSREAMCQWLQGNDQFNSVRVGELDTQVEARVLRSIEGNLYLSTHPDGKPANNILNLPPL